MQEAHLKQWKHNREFVSSIDPEFPDWAVTSIFYTALHAVDALLQHDKIKGITSHEARNRTLRNTRRYEKIWKQYQVLFQLARTVRYLANPKTWVPWQKIESEVLARYLYPLEASVQRLMQRDLQAPLLTMKPQQPNPEG